METPDFSTSLNPLVVRELIRRWLDEDVPSFDFGGVVVGRQVEKAVITCKKDGVLSGVPFVDEVFRALDCEIEWLRCEGSHLCSPCIVANVKGPARNLLLGERLALNIITRASGVATAASRARRIAREAQWQGSVAGTRKTTPGFRLVEKYSLLVGGVAQHRNNLSSMVMLKDNHIWTAGDITQAVETARQACGFSQKIEVECRSYEEAFTAAAAAADVVMLDNFSPEAARSTAAELKKNFPHLTIEVSGGITLDTLREYMSPCVDVLSMSCLTQGYACVDFSMKILKDGHDPANPIVKFSLSTSSQSDCSIEDNASYTEMSENFLA